MPRDLNRMVRHPLTRTIETAKKEAKQELQREGSIPSTPFVTPEPANPEVTGLDGQPHEVHDFMLGVDALGDPDARLAMSGKKINYYRN